MGLPTFSSAGAGSTSTLSANGLMFMILYFLIVITSCFYLRSSASLLGLTSNQRITIRKTCQNSNTDTLARPQTDRITEKSLKYVATADKSGFGKSSEGVVTTKIVRFFLLCL